VGGTWSRAFVAGVALAALALPGCALIFPFQRVPIEVTPPDAQVFVDGSLAGARNRSPNLRADRDHSVFVKREGYRSELVILKVDRAEGRPRLAPDHVRVQLRPLVPNHDLEVEVERPETPPGR
jgi:hypothetical protein